MEPEIPLAKDYKLFTQDGLFWVESKSLQSVSFIEARSGKEVLYHSGTGWKRSSTNCPQLAITTNYQDLEVTVTAWHIVLNYSCGQNLFSKLFDRKTAKEVLFEGHSSFNHLAPSKREIERHMLNFKRPSSDKICPPPQHYSTPKKETSNTGVEYEKLGAHRKRFFHEKVESQAKKPRLKLERDTEKEAVFDGHSNMENLAPSTHAASTTNGKLPTLVWSLKTWESIWRQTEWQTLQQTPINSTNYSMNRLV